jgi:hypothetical protein
LNRLDFQHLACAQAVASALFLFFYCVFYCVLLCFAVYRRLSERRQLPPGSRFRTPRASGNVSRITHHVSLWHNSPRFGLERPIFVDAKDNGVNTPWQLRRDPVLSKNHAKPHRPPEKAGFVRAPKANPIFHTTVNCHLFLVCTGAFLAREPAEFHHALNQSPCVITGQEGGGYLSGLRVTSFVGKWHGSLRQLTAILLATRSTPAHWP